MLTQSDVKSRENGSTMRISFLAPRLPPAVCGVADHTRLLAGAMADQGAQVGFISAHPAMPGESESALGGPIGHWSGGPRSLIQCLAQQGAEWLWVQLSSYGFERKGAPWRLARALAASRRAMPRLRIAVYAHETHCRPFQLGRLGFLWSPWQRYTVGEVARRADLVFSSNSTYLRTVVGEYHVTTDKARYLPLGSNLPQVDLSAEERAEVRRGLGWRQDDVVAASFGMFGSQLRALEGCGPSLARGVDSGHLDRVVCLGGDRTSVPEEFGDWARRLRVLEVLGHQPARRIAEVLASSDFAFTDYPRNLLGKSGAVIGFVMAGLPVLSGDARRTQAPPEAPPIIALESWDWQQARSPAIRHMRSELREYGRAHHAWPSIARRALEAFGQAAEPAQSRDLSPAGKGVA